VITDPLTRLLAFCHEEYEFYDAVTDSDPDEVTALDVAITIAVNSFVNTATRLRQVQRGLATACDSILSELPRDARLDASGGVESAIRLIRGAVAVPWVLVPVATKVLHRKRPALVPMLDQVVLDYYLNATGNSSLRTSTQDKRRAASTAQVVLEELRKDLIEQRGDLAVLRDEASNVGFLLEPVRILDILLWTEVEPRGYYRILVEG